MPYNQLYDVLAKATEVAISVNHVREHCSRLTSEEVIEFVPSDFDEGVILGAIVRGGGLARPYATDPDPMYCNVYYGRGLNECWKRFVCCKELMHLFDKPGELTDDERKFRRHITELLSNPPHNEETSPQVHSESRAYWRAVAALCPLPLRGVFLDRYARGAMTSWDIANKFRVPEVLVPTIMSDVFPEYVAAVMDG